MKIKSIHVKNFKTIKDIHLAFNQDISLIVGKNNIGKSNVLKALKVFFDNLSDLSKVHSEPEDFRKSASIIKIDVKFSGLKDQANITLERLHNEYSKKRSNQKIIKELEMQYFLLELFSGRNDEIEIFLEIAREGSKKFGTSKLNKTKYDAYKDRITSSLIIEQIFQQTTDKETLDYLKSLQTGYFTHWLSYKWLKKEDNEGIIKYSAFSDTINAIEGTIQIDEKTSKSFNETSISNRILSFIKDRQRFLYIPAYRGGEKERNDAIEKLFDFVIEDLVKGKGVTTEYDNITDAIWGTGKNKNHYNLNRIVKERLDVLTTNIKKESISTINEIRFKPLNKEEIRHNILRIMLGTSKLILDDGIETSYESKGTGVQSSFMISLLKSLSQIQFGESMNIILVIEEPEAFTHPQLTREIMEIMCSQQDNDFFQFIITTHSPIIVNLVDASKIQRLSEKNLGASKETINNTKSKKLPINHWNQINQTCDINISEIVFADFVVFVEGEGDKPIISELLKICLKEKFNKISIINICGNLQIFKLKKLLDYFDINWILISDKDGFVDKRIEDKEITSQNLLTFFNNYQIGNEHQEKYRSVLSNPVVEKIIISRDNVANLGMGELLRKINEICPNISIDQRDNLFAIISQKVSDEFIPESDAINDALSFNSELRNRKVPFYSLPGDLESFVVKSSTYDSALIVFESYFKDSYDSFILESLNFTQVEKIRELQKRYGSKRYTLNKTANSAKERKKPHIPIEIMAKHLEKLNSEGRLTKDKILQDFPEISLLVNIIDGKI